LFGILLLATDLTDDLQNARMAELTLHRIAEGPVIEPKGKPSRQVTSNSEP
jgi:hypothetical protein